MKMTITDLLIECDQKNIPVFFKSLPLTESVSICFDRQCCIGIDDSDMTEAQKKTHLAHEMGHCETGAFYCAFSPIDNRSKHEHTANMWAIRKLLPPDQLLHAMEEGDREVWQLAERFDVSEDLIRFAVYEYFDIAC